MDVILKNVFIPIWVKIIKSLSGPADLLRYRLEKLYKKKLEELPEMKERLGAYYSRAKKQLIEYFSRMKEGKSREARRLLK